MNGFNKCNKNMQIYKPKTKGHINKHTVSKHYVQEIIPFLTHCVSFELFSLHTLQRVTVSLNIGKTNWVCLGLFADTVAVLLLLLTKWLEGAPVSLISLQMELRMS